MNQTIRMFSAKRTLKKAAVTWAGTEFGEAELGDERRTQRLIQMAAKAAASPGGTITQVFSTSAEREGAYRFIENEAVAAKDITRAASIACFQRADCDYVIVPVDGCTLSLTAAKNNPNFGPVGTRNAVAQGLEVMNAIAVSPDGTPLGVCAQRFWVRERNKRKKKANRPLEEKETRYWLEVLEETLQAHKLSGSKVRPWFQLDRGGDFGEALMWASVVDADFTTRACNNRRVRTPEEDYLWETVQHQAALGTYELQVSAGPNRTARKATIEVKSCPVVLPLKSGVQVELFAVYAREISSVPQGEEPIDWMLLTNRQVTDLESACLVIFSYSLRWRIEEVHKSWKSTCQIEKSALEEEENLAVWAAILFSVAVRIERLKRLARTAPNKPADVELTDFEIQALLALKDVKALAKGKAPTIGQAVLWIAELGGYTGKSSGGPPGSITLGRGLKKLEPAVQLLKNLSRITPS